jgi:hypothetical protein
MTAASASSAGLSVAQREAAEAMQPGQGAFERRADVHEAFLTLGCALITWRYLKREF